MPGPNQPTQPGTPSPYPDPIPLHFEPPVQNPPLSQSPWQQFLRQQQDAYAAEIRQRVATVQPWSPNFNPQPNPLLAPGAPLLRQGNPQAGDPKSVSSFSSTLGEAEPMDQMSLMAMMMGRG